MKNFTEFLLAKVNTKQREYAKSFNYDHLLHLTLMSSSELKKLKKAKKEKENTKKRDALILLLDKVEPSIISYFQHARKLFNLIMVKSTGNYEDDKKIISATFKRIPLIDVFFPFIDGRKDFMHYRNSGLNNVLVDLLKQQNIALGIDFSFLLSQDQNCIVKLGRIIQNIKFGQKRNINFCVTFLPASIGQLRDALDVKSLLVCLGMTPGNANKALQFAYSRYVQNKKRKQITRGIIEL